MNKLTKKQRAWVETAFHNFGARGSANPETAMYGGMAHLVAGFMGSDNFSSMRAVKYYYDVEDIGTICHSINATEHSSTTAWGKEGEMDMIMNHLENNKGQAIIAAVMDSYDYHKAVKEVCRQDGEFQRKINSPDYPIFVLRPDSGDPSKIIPETLDIMEYEDVPYTINSKGYKVFNKMRIIWGDGINTESMDIMLNILKKRKYSSENIAFGSGGWLMTQHDRDTQGWAVKCSEITLDEGNPIETGVIHEGKHEMIWEDCLVTRDVFKDPKTAPNKKSKKGKMTLWYNPTTGSYFTDKVDANFDNGSYDAMETVFENGEMVRTYTLEEVRKNSMKG